MKIKRSWLLYFVCIICLNFNLDAANSLQDLKLFNDASLNSIWFGTLQVDGKMQIFQTIKPFGNPNWGADSTISDPDVSVVAYNVRKDEADNFLVGWIGENTSLGIYSLYMRYYLEDTNTWSPITMLTTNQNLVGDFSIMINTVTAEVIWTIYDEFFNVEKQSATFILSPV